MKEKGISIIIPAYNASGTIAGCLDSLTRQCTDECEIIVVDDGSTDNTAEIVNGYRDVRLVRQKNMGPAMARNEGARLARGWLILFTDSDCVPSSSWLDEMTAPFKLNPAIAGVKGKYLTLQKEPVARFVQYEYEDKYDRMLGDHYIDFIDTYSAAFRREVFLEMGGYDTGFPVACAEDVELSYRMHEKGHRMVFNPNAVVYHRHPASLGGYLRKKFKFAYWRVLAVKKNPKKAVRDSHTPQTMKFQALLAPMVIASAAASVFVSFAHAYLVVLSALFIATTVPFTVKTVRKDLPVGLVSPVMLLLRGSWQFAGVVCGSAAFFRKG